MNQCLHSSMSEPLAALSLGVFHSQSQYSNFRTINRRFVYFVIIQFVKCLFVSAIKVATA